MTERDAFLRAIAESPDDDAPRLVFADWLDEHGDPARAEFIRSQCELATLDEADPRYPQTLARSRRCGVLTRTPTHPFVDHVPGGRVLFRRGLIAGVQMDAPAYLATSPQSWEGVPIEQLWLREQVDAQRLAERPELARLHTLAIQTATPELVGGPHLASLRHLRLAFPDHYPDEDADDDEDKVVARLDLPALESLHLEGDLRAWQSLVQQCRNPLRRLVVLASFEGGILAHQLPDALLSWLPATHHWPHLEYLAIRHTVGSGSYSTVEYRESVHPIRRAFETGRLRHLSVDPRSLPELLACPSWAGLESLEVGQRPEEGEREVMALMASPHVGRLRSLRLDYWPETPADPAVALGAAFGNLRHLWLREYSDRPAFAGLAGLSCPHLLRLDFLCCSHMNDALVRFIEMSFPQLRHLTIGGYGLESVDLSPLYRARNLPNLCTLILENPNMTREMAEQLARAPGLPNLSLVGSPGMQDRMWILADGHAHPVHPDVLPLDCDWWQFNPDEDWNTFGMS